MLTCSALTDFPSHSGLRSKKTYRAVKIMITASCVEPNRLSVLKDQSFITKLIWIALIFLIVKSFYILVCYQFRWFCRKWYSRSPLRWYKKIDDWYHYYKVTFQQIQLNITSRYKLNRLQFLIIEHKVNGYLYWDSPFNWALKLLRFCDILLLKIIFCKLRS